MSQNLDATAINQIHALISAQGVNEIISKIGADAVALPENFRITESEKFNLDASPSRGALPPPPPRSLPPFLQNFRKKRTPPFSLVYNWPPPGFFTPGVFL
ncbi:DUF2303 family protein [Escherichia coli]|uniref:DUF2303 family protein n=1 Tax=Escherichia coli TaxID=562 RepID=UPI003A8541A5